MGMFEPKPSAGFVFCRNVTCGVEVNLRHPTRACRAHRADGKTRLPVRAPLVVTPAWTLLTMLWVPL